MSTSTDPHSLHTEIATEQRYAALSSAKLELLTRRLDDCGATGHALVAHSLRTTGVSNVFGIMGTPVNETFGACARAGIRLIGTRHQSTASMASVAHNYVSGRLSSAAIVSAGPAVTNAATGVLYARDNAMPLIVIGGRRDVIDPREGHFQSLDARPLYAPLTKHAGLIDSASAIERSIHDAAALTTSGRQGPVYLDITEAALSGRARHACTEPHRATPSGPTTDASLECALRLIMRAERPAVIFGKGLRWNNAFEEMRLLVEALGLPFITSPMARGLISDDHPFAFSSIAAKVQAEADLVILAGARLDWKFRFGTHLDPTACVIRIDADPDDVRQGDEVAVDLEGDAGTTLRLLRAAIDADAHTLRRSAPSHAWLDSLRRARAGTAAQLQQRLHRERVSLSTHTAMACVRDFLPTNAVTILDGNVSMAIAQQIIPCRLPLGRMTAGSNGTMGIGLPLAIGARLAAPERLTMAICGDFAFGLSAVDIETAVRHRIPVIILVIDNGGINAGTTQRDMLPADSEPVSAYGDHNRYDRLAEALGAHGEFVDTAASLPIALERAAQSGSPAVVHIRIE